MQTRAYIKGYSDLKNLLVQSYNIEKESALIILYFTTSKNELIVPCENTSISGIVH